MQVKAIRIHQTGGPEALRYETVDLPEPGPGQVRVRHRAIGVNFIDVYMRTGLYATAPLPAVLGMEAAGVVEALGPDVAGLTPGTRVAYALQPGAYAEAQNVAAAQLVVLPPAISEETAAAMMLKGMTAEFLIRRAYAVKKGETILVHAAAGGVGLLLCQWADHLGARVIGIVSNAQKAELAKAHGCSHVLLAGQDDVAAQVRTLTDGKGVPVVYDSVGQATFALSLECLARRGLLVSYGNSSGPVTGVNLSVLQRRSNYVTRPTLRDYLATRAELDESAHALFEVVAAGRVKVEIRQRFALADVAKAHRALEARETTGATILIP
jgi:NADPH2:quinone reductase